MQLDGGGHGWRRVCRAPCDQVVDPRLTYSIRGGNRDITSEDTDSDGNGLGTYSTHTYKLVSSGPFHISPSPGAQTLTVSSVDSSSRLMGGIFLFGSAGLFVGAGLMLGDVFDSTGSARHALTGVGVGLTVAGTGFTALGLYSILRATHVVDDSGRKLARARPSVQLTPTGLVF